MFKTPRCAAHRAQEKVGVGAARAALALRIAGQARREVEAAGRSRRLIVVAEEEPVFGAHLEGMASEHQRHRVGDIPGQCAAEPDRAIAERRVAVAEIEGNTVLGTLAGRPSFDGQSWL